MNDFMKMYGDTYVEFNELVINIREMNLNLINSSKQQKLYNLFSYLVNNGYKNIAEDLWYNVIRNNFIVRPL
jgi:hypothetical protein